MAKGSSPAVIYRSTFGGNVLIKPGELSLSIEKKNDFREANLTYDFKINVQNQIDSDTVMYINFTSDWNLWK